MPTNEIELTVESMAFNGQTVGRHQGRVVFVAGAIPHERVRAQITLERPRWARAQVTRVLHPSPHRVEPCCPYFGQCGGCDFQHIGYAAQLDYKRQIVIEQLQRTSHIDNPSVAATLGMDSPWQYRNHVEFSFDAQGQVGLQAAHSHQVIPIQRCLLIHPLLEDMYAGLGHRQPGWSRLTLRVGANTSERMGIVETGKNLRPEVTDSLPGSWLWRHSRGDHIILRGSDAYHERLREQTLRVSAGSFFQVNTTQTEAMLDAVESFLSPQPDDTLVDVYCGVGAIGLSMIDRVGQLIGIEENPAAIADAQINSRGRGLWIGQQAEAALTWLKEPVSAIILDPPRQGCRPSVLAALAHLRPRRIVYISCDPTTLARDAVHLIQAGFRLVHAQPVDMFPQTCHIETVSCWTA